MTYFKMELLRVLRDPVTMFFAVVLPGFFYLLFGDNTSYGEYPLGNGNIAFYTMVGMASYGAMTATTVIGGMAAMERMQGWGRQLGLTPMTDGRFVATKTLVSLTIAIVPVLATFLLGLFTSADATWWVWFASGAIIMAGSAVFALYGLCFGLAFRSEAALSASSGSLVILGFLGNVFIPLSGTMLTISKFTPLYGVVALARYPMTGGEAISMNTGETFQESLWPMIANVAVWTAIFGLIAVLLVRRSRGRQ